MSTGMSDPQENQSLQSMMIPTIAVIGEILANCYIIWFLLIDVPTKCAYLAAETAGRQTYGLETGAYVLSLVSGFLILAGVYYLAKWHFTRDM